MTAEESEYFYGVPPEIRVCNSVSAFIDILGYTTRVEEAESGNQTNDVLHLFYSSFMSCIELIKEDEKRSPLQSKLFSDNIFLTFPVLDGCLKESLWLLIDSVMVVQYKMALKGFFMRGGISEGYIFVNDHCVFGTGLINAYKIESNRHCGAIYPRTLIDRKLNELIRESAELYHSCNFGSMLYRDRFSVSETESYFVNYLAKSIIDADDLDAIEYEELKAHRDAIRVNLTKAACESIIEKYSWLKKYHNAFCKQLSWRTDFDDDVYV